MLTPDHRLTPLVLLYFMVGFFAGAMMFWRGGGDAIGFWLTTALVVVAVLHVSGCWHVSKGGELFGLSKHSWWFVTTLAFLSGFLGVYFTGN